jgi:hypothetical protein
MCPMCLATLALYAAGAGSTGGVAALVATEVRAWRRGRLVRVRFDSNGACASSMTPPRKTPLREVKDHED